MTCSPPLRVPPAPTPLYLFTTIRIPGARNLPCSMSLSSAYPCWPYAGDDPGLDDASPSSSPFSTLAMLSILYRPRNVVADFPISAGATKCLYISCILLPCFVCCCPQDCRCAQDDGSICAECPIRFGRRCAKVRLAAPGCRPVSGLQLNVLQVGV